MGIFDKWNEFKENRRVGRIESSKKLIRRDKVNKDERAAAIEFFCDLEDHAIAVPTLLGRFEFSADNGIVDTREKERALDGVISRGQDAVPHIKEFLKTTSRIAWPIKALSKLTNDAEVISTLQNCLDYSDVSFDQAKIEKNYDLLCYLADYEFSGYSEKLNHFLGQHDERLRFAAAELMVQQNDDNVSSFLEKFAYDSSEENRRLRKTVLEAFTDKGWKLSEPKQFNEQPAPGFRVTGDGKVTKA